MKKAAVLIIAVLLIVSISGCSNSAALEISPSPTDIPQTTASPFPATPLPATPSLAPSPSPTAEATPTAVLPDLTQSAPMYVTHRSVNVRAGASAGSQKIISLKQNTQVDAYQNIDGWYYIQYAPGQFGYMSAKYLSEQPVATPEPELPAGAKIQQQYRYQR